MSMFSAPNGLPRVPDNQIHHLEARTWVSARSQSERLTEMGDWLKINGEAIYGTRPWLVYGEGEVKARGGAMRENMTYTAKDIRFTTKGKTLYAIALGWPEGGKLAIKSLAKTSDAAQNKIKKVELLGYKGKLKFEQTADALIVELPDVKLSDLTCSLRINGSNLKPASAPAENAAQ